MIFWRFFTAEAWIAMEW